MYAVSLLADNTVDHAESAIRAKSGQVVGDILLL